MDGADRRPEILRAALAVGSLLAATGLTGCGGQKEPEVGERPTRAAQEIAAAKAEAEATEAADAAEAAAPPAEEGEKPATLVLREGERFPAVRVEEPPEEEPSLWEASQAERRRRAESGTSKIVITDENLQEYSSKGQLTELITEPLPGESLEAEVAEETEDLETYWRDRVRDARLSWRAAADRVVELESEVARLRHEFYAAVDAFYRDSEIKPAWDRAALELERARASVEERRLEVQLVLEEGVRDDALPGWLREGIEFEPEVPDEQRPQAGGELPIVEAIETPIAEEPPK